MVNLCPEWAANRIQDGEGASVVDEPKERYQSKNHGEIQSYIQYACEHESWNSLGNALMLMLDEIAEIRRQQEGE